MKTRIKALLNDNGSLLGDFAGAASLMVILVALLHLPALA